MRKFAVTAAPLALLCAIAGYLIRRDWWHNALEYVKAPPVEAANHSSEAIVAIRGAWQSTALVLLSAAFFICSVIYLLIVRKKLESGGYSMTIVGVSPTPRFISYAMLICSMLSAIMLFAAGVFLIRASDKFAVISGAAAFISACACAVVPLASMRRPLGTKKKLNGWVMALSLIPEIFMTMLLVSLYKDNQTDPVILRYAPAAVSLAFAAMSYYSDAAYVYRKPSPSRSVFFKMMAVFSAGVALADMPRRYRLAVESAVSFVSAENTVAQYNASAAFWFAAGLAIGAALLISCVSLFALTYSLKPAQKAELTGAASSPEPPEIA